MSREVRRVPLDFDNGGAGLRQVWPGYLRPDDLDGDPCRDCHNPVYRQHSDGMTPEARGLWAQWYGWADLVDDLLIEAYDLASWRFDPTSTGSTPYDAQTAEVWAMARGHVERAPEYYGTGAWALWREAQRLADLFNSRWCHHLSQLDVDVLIEHGRLMDFTHTWEADRTPRWQPIEPAPMVSAEQVNRWSLRGMGHDSLNAMIVIEARAKREGITTACPTCDGHATVERYPGQREAAENWESTEPPTGEGWQLWETTTEGSPVSEVFPTADALVDWLLTDAGQLAAGFGHQPAGFTRETARAFVEAGSSVGSFVVIEQGDGSKVGMAGALAAGLDRDRGEG